MKKIKRMLGFIVINFIVTFLFLGSNAFAQEEIKKATKLDTVVVTATKKEATLLETPATISIITAEDIERSGQKDLAAIISSVPGVWNETTTPDESLFSFRGTRSSMVSGPIVMVDGKPYNFGVYGLNSIGNIAIDHIERIEIIKSPPPSVYGTNSARGVINIITKRGKYAKKPVQVIASGGIGAWGTYKSLATISGKKNQWDYLVSGNYEKSDGYRHTDPEKRVFSGKFGYEFDKGIKCGMDVNWSDSFYKIASGSSKRWALDDYRRDIRYIRNSETGATYNCRPNEYDKELLTGGLSFNYDRDNWLFDSSVYISHFDYISQKLSYYNNISSRKNCYTTDQDTDNIGFKISGGYNISHEDRFSNTIKLGYDFSREDFGQEKTYPYDTTSSHESSIKKGNIDCNKDIDSLFITNDFKYLEKYGLLAGLRYDIAEYDLRNQVPQSATKKFKELGWNIAPSLSFTPDTNLFFSLSESYWFPASYYVKAAMEKDHPDNKVEDLGPEEYLTYELGFKHRLMKSVNYSISFFRSKVKHKYMSFYDDGGTFRGYKPIGDSIHEGIEIEVDGRLWEWFGYRLGFAWIDAEWDKAETKLYIHDGATPADDTYEVTDISGKKLYSVPEYIYSVGVDFYPLKSLQFSITVHGLGESYVDALNRYKESAYNVVDAKLNYTLDRWNFYLSGSNLFDEKSEKLYNPSGKRNSTGGPDHYWYPRNGKYFEVGATVKF